MSAAPSKYVGGPGLSTKDAQALGALIDDAIRAQHGQLGTQALAREVVRRSRPKMSPTHGLFEWDQAKGHALYLVARASDLIIKVNVVFDAMPNEPLRAFRVVTSDGHRTHVTLDEARSSQAMMEELLAQAKAALANWSRQFEQLRRLGQLSGVFEAIDKHAAPRKRKTG